MNKKKGLLWRLFLYPSIFHMMQEICRKKTWNIKSFPMQDKWSVTSFRCKLLGFVLGSLKCPACNEVDCLSSYESYDSITILCDKCNTSYYQCAGFRDFGEHAAAVTTVRGQE